MKIVVCIKVSGGEISPFDKSALESALRLSDDVEVISMGPESTKDVLLPLTRFAAKVTLLCDPAFAGSDTLATSYILSLAIKRANPDLVFCGRQSLDGDTAQVGPCLSAILGIGCITNVMRICDVADEKISCETRLGLKEQPFPSLLTIERICELRFPSIYSKLGSVAVITNDDLGADISRCGINGSPTRVLKVFENKSDIRNCRFISKSELMPLINELKNQIRQEKTHVESAIKLPEVWAVGHKVAPKAYEIAEKVKIIDTDNPYEVSELARREKPAVILWNADFEGRKNAPVVAALLKTGLCADCTALETDGETLFMYRPARSGNVIAKIKCLTLPQMATVRTVSPASDVIVAAGKGVSDNVEDIKSFAKKIGGEFGASRGLVDMGRADYKYQIGLTGKTVSPLIYIAIGISGAVHHTCAIEAAKTIIAINPDRNARIFEYADYGIVDRF